MFSFFKNSYELAAKSDFSIQQKVIIGLSAYLIEYVLIELLLKLQEKEEVDDENEFEGTSPLELNVIDPIIEEFINRRIVIAILETILNKSGISNHYIQSLSLLGSSFIFSKVHKPGIQQETFLAGLVYGATYQFCNKSILPGSIAHIINNLVSSYAMLQKKSTNTLNHGSTPAPTSRSQDALLEPADKTWDAVTERVVTNNEESAFEKSTSLMKSLLSPRGGWIESSLFFLKTSFCNSENNPEPVKPT